MIFSFFPLAFAQADVCCEKLNGDAISGEPGTICQNAPVEECELSGGYSYAQTACDFPGGEITGPQNCALGTCIYPNGGICSSNTPYLKCIEDGGSWDDKNIEEIGICNVGCCIVGDDADLHTEVECRQLTLDNGIDLDDLNWRDDMTDRQECLDLGGLKREGACVHSNLDCDMTTRERCQDEGDRFGEGFLCTAQHLGSICEKNPETTRCTDRKVYYTDTCGNLANVYDENKWGNENYWTFMQDPDCGQGDNTCGDCSYGGYYSGENERPTTCQEYKSGNPFTPFPADKGDYVCAELGCEYKDITYEHGEKWCASLPGTEYVIRADNQGYLTEESREFMSTLDYVLNYNLPGSGYSVLECREGKIIHTPCEDFRNEYCIESSLEMFPSFTVASCRTNYWRECLDEDITTKEECENPESLLDCKWVPGYSKANPQQRESGSSNERYQEEIGTCVPLIAPGMDFWEDDENNTILASLGNFTDEVYFEVEEINRRSQFRNFGIKLASERCLFNCYLIPRFGFDLDRDEPHSPEYVFLNILWKGHKLENKIKTYQISRRESFYCKTSSGVDYGYRANCGSDPRHELPIYLTHEEWYNNTRLRSLSYGDVGAKRNFLSFFGANKRESVTVTYEKIRSDGDHISAWDPDKEVYVDGRIVDGYRDVDALVGLEGYYSGYLPSESSSSEGSSSSGGSSTPEPTYNCNEIDCPVESYCDPYLGCISDSDNEGGFKPSEDGP